jgi:hypothetical protein
VAGKREKVFHISVRSAGIYPASKAAVKVKAIRVKEEREPGFTGWTIGRSEIRNGVTGRDPVAGELELGIDGGV